MPPSFTLVQSITVEDAPRSEDLIVFTSATGLVNYVLGWSKQEPATSNLLGYAYLGTLVAGKLIAGPGQPILYTPLGRHYYVTPWYLVDGVTFDPLLYAPVVKLMPYVNPGELSVYQVNGAALLPTY